ncbi:MAG: DUF4159 domain-containing protein [Rubricella sp.]
MLSLGSLAFFSPWYLVALAALPLIWWLLRAQPPAPKLLRFPAVSLLAGLDDEDRMPERTPWWLLLLRLAALAALILALAEPVMNPRDRDAPGEGPLLVLFDGGWASAPDWPARIARAEVALEEAGRLGRPVIVASLSDPPPEGGLEPRAAQSWLGALATLDPAPWAPDRAAFAERIDELPGSMETLWFQDGLGPDAGLSAALTARGTVTAFRAERPPLGLAPPRFADGGLSATVLRIEPGAERRAVLAIGPDPSGVERVLGRAEAVFEGEETAVEASFDLPLDIVNRVNRIAIEGVASAGAVALADDGLRRREIGLVAGGEPAEGIRLLDPLHYLRAALAPVAELYEVPLADLMLLSPDVIMLADVGTLAASERRDLEAWVEEGGTLVRFAGPRLAASETGTIERDPLLPVRLRAGGRSVGGAMSWGAPRTLAPFPSSSPFARLVVPGEVTVTSQVMAQPDPDLAERTLAALEDGTPLVTARPLGQGRVILFHVTANADWSSLPLSGVFVDMLDRIVATTRSAGLSAAEIAPGLSWTPDVVLDGFGRLSEATATQGVESESLSAGRPGPGLPPGLYSAAGQSLALNVLSPDTELVPHPVAEGIAVEGMALGEERNLAGWAFLAALMLLAADIVAALALAGRLVPGRRVAGALALGAGLVLLAATDAQAQPMTDEEAALFATSDTVLAHVLTGDEEIDAAARAGLRGLAFVLTQRTAVEPLVASVDVETDELAFYPILYWPVTDDAERPSDEAYARINTFLRSGGMILFDTMDAQIAGFGSETPTSIALRRIADGLDLPPLEPVPQDHVLTRTFYLLDAFPGRHATGEVWVEASPEAELEDGMPFRQLNDGVSPVLIGGNDWASAWAIDDQGFALFPVGRGSAGERQREIAYRFGVNLVMYVLTGNYKSDQVHVPALLERLGQ